MNAKFQTIQKKAVIYCRVSTKEQVDEGNSLSTQEKICREYCNKNNYEIAEIFNEQGESAKTANRTELQKLLTYCADKKHGVNAIVIYKVDRLSRNTDDYSQLRLLLKRYGVEIKSTSEHFEDTPTGRFMENTMANIAQFDNDIRSERCAGGMKEAMRDGRYVWMATVGYRNVKIAGRATIEQDDKMAPIVLRTFEMVASGIYPTEEVRRIMAKDGLLNKTGKPFSKGYFYCMLKNELFTGWIVKFGERHRGTFTPIVSEELFNQVQMVLKHKGRKHSAYITDNPDFPLRKFVVNENGKKLTGSWSKGRYKKYPFYRFGGNNSNHSRDSFEEAFMEYMDTYAFDDKKIAKLKLLVRENLTKATVDQRKDKDRLLRQQEELKEKQTGIIKKNLDGYIPDDIMKQQLDLIRNDMFQISSQLLNYSDSEINYDEAIDYVEGYLMHPSKVWKESNIDVKVKLQWFQFPQGLVYEDNIFGTKEISLFFKTKDAFSASQSSRVDRTGLEPATPALQKQCSTR